MVRQCHVGRGRPFASPVLEVRMQRRKFIDIVPNRFERSLNDFTRQRFVTHKVNVIGKNASVAHNPGGYSRFDCGDIIALNRHPYTLFFLSRTIQRNEADPDVSFRFLDLGGSNGVVADIRPSLNHRIDTIIDGRDGDDFDIIPGHPSVREPGENMKPDSYVRRIFASHPLSLNIIDGLDSRVLLDDKAYLQRRATHDESRVWNVR